MSCAPVFFDSAHDIMNIAVGNQYLEFDYFANIRKRKSIAQMFLLFVGIFPGFFALDQGYGSESSGIQRGIPLPFFGIECML